MSHGTAAWLHKIRAEPTVIEAYVRELPTEPTPTWLYLRVADSGIYNAAGSYGPDVVQLKP
jgi:hypothetical protein